VEPVSKLRAGCPNKVHGFEEQTYAVSISRHCEKRSDEAISNQLIINLKDCFARLVMTKYACSAEIPLLQKTVSGAGPETLYVMWKGILRQVLAPVEVPVSGAIV
jgi:hypothetical protein